MEGNFESEAAYHSEQSAPEAASNPSRQQEGPAETAPTGGPGRLFNTMFGSGKPAWGRSGDDPHNDGGESGLNRRNNAGSGNGSDAGGSYQRGGPDGNNNYQAPQFTGTYADQQTQVVEDTMRNQIQAETSAGNVMASMQAQKNQLENARDDVWGMRVCTAQAKRELAELQSKARKKKKRLYVFIGILGSLDFLLLMRIFQCGGSFFCRRY